MKQVRQGDIFLMAVNVDPPKDAIAKTEVVLATGELTGHAHRALATEILEWSVDGQRYIRVIGSEAGALVHQDHDPVPAPVIAPEQTYRIIPQRETNLSEEWQPVVD